jgi:hypothetical protein
MAGGFECRTHLHFQPLTGGESQRHQSVTTAQSNPMKSTVHTKSPPHPQA